MEKAPGWSKMVHTLTDSSREWRLTFSVTFEWGLFICTWRSSRWKKFTLSWKVSEPPEKSDSLGEGWAVNTSNIYRAFLRLTAQISFKTQKCIYHSKVWRQNSQGSFAINLAGIHTHRCTFKEPDREAKLKRNSCCDEVHSVEAPIGIEHDTPGTRVLIRSHSVLAIFIPQGN